MALSASSGLPALAATSSFSSMSVILVMAEWTTSTRAAGFEAALDDQRDVAPVGERGDAGAAELDDDPARCRTRGHALNLVATRARQLTDKGTRPLLLVFEAVFQVFFETTVREHFFEPAPGCLADFFACRAADEHDDRPYRGCGRSRCCLQLRPGTLRLNRSFRYPVRTSFFLQKNLFETVSYEPGGHAMRLRTIADSRSISTAPKLGGPGPPERPK